MFSDRISCNRCGQTVPHHYITVSYDEHYCDEVCQKELKEKIPSTKMSAKVEVTFDTRDFTKDELIENGLLDEKTNKLIEDEIELRLTKSLFEIIEDNVLNKVDFTPDIEVLR